MPVAPPLRSLEIDLPACPQVLVDLSLLLHDEGANTNRIGALIEADMALAAAVVRSVNSALFGLMRRVESVTEAVRYLGTREVAMLTYEIGLRGAFPPMPLLDALWERASRRGLAMGRAAGVLDIDPWLAHSAGLFAECGQAALVAHDADGYDAMVKRQPDALARIDTEIAHYGVSHAALGGALCQAWGMAGEISETVRQRPLALATMVVPTATPLNPPADDWQHEPPMVRKLMALMAAIDLALAAADAAVLARACAELARPAGVDAGLLQQAAAAGVARVGG
ncbi:HDOD domain-containing protein [Caldimonas sp. KR1-144]|uniref:HDOD domain-containing protein n=1 Tax=Caldimonas sp. KR1-144 TaxID=3400911 RepID=UPI003C0CF724